MTSTRSIRASVAMLCVAAMTGAFAASANDKAERARIENERKAAEQAFEAKDHECHQHFVVTSCVDAAQRERRETLKRLRVQQELLDEADRRERAAQRLESIREKENGADAKQREAMARQQQKNLSGASAASAAASAAPKPPATRLPRAPAPALPRTTAASAAARASDRAERQQEVEAHRLEVERRNAERAAKGKKSIPLPIPASIPVPASAAKP